MDINSISSTLAQSLRTSYNNVGNKTDKESSQTPSTLFSRSDTVTISAEASQRKTIQGTEQSASTDSENGTGSSQLNTKTATSSSATATENASNSSDTSTVDELEKQIQALKEEIASLSTKALTDESAKVELSRKQAELYALIAQLQQLQSAQS